MLISEMVKAAHENAKEKGFWDKEVDDGKSIALMHSELSEALEALRINSYRDHTYYRASDGKPEGLLYELADCVIRIADYCGKHNLDLQYAIEKKMNFNKTRPPMHGKKF